MTRYLALLEVLDLHRRLIEAHGGMHGVRDQGSLESAVAQPQMTFGGEDLYRSLEEKAVALAYSLIMNHPFLDGNKRIGHAAMESFLILNGSEIVCDTDEQESVVLSVAAGQTDREQLLKWLQSRVKKLNAGC
jgi:death on curing protein